MERYKGSLSPENIDVRRLSHEQAVGYITDLWNDGQYKEMVASMFHAVDSTKLTPEMRVLFGLPPEVGNSATSIYADLGPTLIDLKAVHRPRAFVCQEAEKNLWLSRNDKHTPKTIMIMGDLLEVKFYSLVLALPKQTFEYIDPSGRGHVFIKDIWYEPLPGLYLGAQLEVNELRYRAVSGIKIDTDTLEQIQWRANRHFSSKRYALVEAAAQIIASQSGV